MHDLGTSRARRAFTLIELLIAVAVASVLVAIALPSFLEQLARARRTEVQAALLEDAGYMQHYYSSHNAYTDTLAPQLPFTRTPRAGIASYAIGVSVPAGDPTSFLLTAVRSGAMSSDPCGDFTYDSLGQRGLVNGTFAGGRDVLRCWR
jgi:type IV pilus assembly protein PilE